MLSPSQLSDRSLNQLGKGVFPERRLGIESKSRFWCKIIRI